MVKDKEAKVIPRPEPPTPEQILADVTRCSEDDPVFLSPAKIFGENDLNVGSAEVDDEIDDSDMKQVEEKYIKVCDLLDMLSSIRSGKDRLKNLCQQLLCSKEDVSAVALQLKTRLEKHKVISNRIGKP